MDMMATRPRQPRPRRRRPRLRPLPRLRRHSHAVRWLEKNRTFSTFSTVLAVSDIFVRFRIFSGVFTRFQTFSGVFRTFSDVAIISDAPLWRQAIFFVGNLLHRIQTLFVEADLNIDQK